MISKDDAILADFIKNNPLENPIIAQFYQDNRGEGPNSFIPEYNWAGDCHIVIYELLKFYDKHGNIDLFVTFDSKGSSTGLNFEDVSSGNKSHKINLIDHVLSTTEIVTKDYRKHKFDLEHSTTQDYRMLIGGIAALSCNIALCFGQDYCDHYNNNFAQASMAILENMTSVTFLRHYKSIREVINNFHLYKNDPRFLGDKKIDAMSDYSISLKLISAEKQVKRKEIFKYSRPHINEKQAESNSAKFEEIFENSEIERNEAGIDMDIAINTANIKNINALNSTIKTLNDQKEDLKLKNSIYKDIIKTQNNIIHFKSEKNIGAKERNRKKLEKLKLLCPELEKTMTSDQLESDSNSD